MLVETVVEAKEQQLRQRLAELPSLIVAFSGGADSAYLAWLAHDVLDPRRISEGRGFSERSGDPEPVEGNPARKQPKKDGALAPEASEDTPPHGLVLSVTAVSASLPERERRFVADFARRHGLRHEFIETAELANPLYVANSPDRCYHCKDELFAQLDALARARGFASVAYGVNCDDLGDFRPGQQAAREHRVLTPLVDAGLTKAEIRQLSRRAGLETWDKPAAACLASRLAYGVAVTEERLKRIEQAEEALRALGFRQLRVRYHEDLVRVEIAPDELPRALAPEMAARIRDSLRPLGFKFITLDLEGYRQGSFNPTI